MIGESVAFFKRLGREVDLRRRALLRRLPARPGLRARDPRRRRRRRAPTASCCATPTAASCPTSSPSGCTRSAPASRRRSASTRTTTAGWRWPTALAAVRAGCVQVQGTINGYGERCGNLDLVPLDRHAAAQARLRGPPGRVAPPAHRGLAVRRRGGQPAPGSARAVRRAERVRPQGRHPRRGHRQAGGQLPARGSDRGGQRDARGRERGGRPAQRAPPRRGARPRRRRAGGGGAAADQGARAPGLPVRGGRTARSRCCYAAPRPAIGRRSSWRTSRSSSRSGAAAGSRAQATVRIRVGDEMMHTAAEGDGPVNALDRAVRKALAAALSRARRSAPGGLQGPHRGRAPRHRRRGRG